MEPNPDHHHWFEPIAEHLGAAYLRYSFTKGTQQEIDFLVDAGDEVVPVEVKAETNLKAKSLKTFHSKFSPEISVRTSMADYKKEDWLINLPLYAIGGINNI